MCRYLAVLLTALALPLYALGCSDQSGCEPRGCHAHDNADKREEQDIAKTRIGRFVGVVMDLGVSSLQLDDAKRVFGFQTDGPVDMRMDRSSGARAEDLLRKLSEKELAGILWDYGQERRARSIARAIVRARTKKRLLWTSELARICERAARGARQRIHPATRTFQALRIAVNDELGGLASALRWMPRVLKAGGVVVVISFHSLEDGIVKRCFKDHGRDGLFDVLTLKPVRPGPQEVKRNRRSRSARLRAARRTPKSAVDEQS